MPQENNSTNTNNTSGTGNAGGANPSGGGNNGNRQKHYNKRYGYNRSHQQRAPRDNSRTQQQGDPQHPQNQQSLQSSRTQQHAAGNVNSATISKQNSEHRHDPEKKSDSAQNQLRKNNNYRNQRRDKQDVKLEETVDDIRQDLVRIQKEIELEIREIGTLKLGL